MAYKLTITELASVDLDEIAGYIMIDLAAPKAAIDFLEAFEVCCTYIKENPYSYEASRDPRLLAEGYRRAVINNHIMLYKVFPDRKEVVIYRLFYGRREYAYLI